MSHPFSAAGVAALSLFASIELASAAFLEDGKADLELRNFYIDRDNRSGDADPSRQSEWGQGFILDLRSGYTEGTVGFGLDVLGTLGIRLDSGKGTHYNPTSDNRGGQVFPTDSDGRAVSQFGSVGPTVKARLASSELKVGTLRPVLPVLGFNDGRLLPQTFEGAQFSSRDIDKLSFTAGKLTKAKGRNSTDRQGLSIAGANNAQRGQFVHSFVFAGADYALSPNLTAQYYYGELENFYQQHFVGLTHLARLPAGSLKTDLRGFVSDSAGKNASAAGRAEGYVGSGYRNNGEVDNRVWSAMFTYSLAGHSVGLGYQQLSGASDFPFVTMGDGVRAYLISDRSLNSFNRAGERSWVGTYAFDFAAVGVPGLSLAADYVKGDHIKTASGERSEWFRGTTVQYAFQNPSVKGLSIALRNGSFRSQVERVRDADENRVTVSYKLALR